MNKSNIINELAQSLGGHKEAQCAVNKIIQIMRDSIRRGEKVVISGIGSFFPKIRKAQRRHNPKTMKPVDVPPKRTVKFIPSSELFTNQ